MVQRPARVEVDPRRIGAPLVLQLRLLGSRHAGVSVGLHGSDPPRGVGLDRLAPGCSVAKLSTKAIVKGLSPSRQTAASQLCDLGLLLNLHVQPLSFIPELGVLFYVAISLPPDLCVCSLPLALQPITGRKQLGGLAAQRSLCLASLDCQGRLGSRDRPLGGSDLANRGEGGVALDHVFVELALDMDRRLVPSVRDALAALLLLAV